MTMRLTDDEIVQEEWRPVPIEGYEKFYKVSNLGRLKSYHNDERILSPSKNSSGYELAHLYNLGIEKCETVHRLVIMAFVGDIPPKHIVNHKNGDRLDNRLSNLEITTQQENILHARDHLEHGLARQTVTREQVEKIIAELAKGVHSLKKIANMFDVSLSTVGSIWKCGSWADLLRPYPQDISYKKWRKIKRDRK